MPNREIIAFGCEIRTEHIFKMNGENAVNYSSFNLPVNGSTIGQRTKIYGGIILCTRLAFC